MPKASEHKLALQAASRYISQLQKIPKNSREAESTQATRILDILDQAGKLSTFPVEQLLILATTAMKILGNPLVFIAFSQRSRPLQERVEAEMSLVASLLRSLLSHNFIADTQRFVSSFSKPIMMSSFDDRDVLVNDVLRRFSADACQCLFEPGTQLDFRPTELLSEMTARHAQKFQEYRFQVVGCPKDTEKDETFRKLSYFIFGAPDWLRRVFSQDLILHPLYLRSFRLHEIAYICKNLFLLDEPTAPTKAAWIDALQSCRDRTFTPVTRQVFQALKRLEIPEADWPTYARQPAVVATLTAGLATTRRELENLCRPAALSSRKRL